MITDELQQEELELQAAIDARRKQLQVDPFSPTAADLIALVASEYGVSGEVAGAWLRAAFGGGESISAAIAELRQKIDHVAENESYLRFASDRVETLTRELAELRKPVAMEPNKTVEQLRSDCRQYVQTWGADTRMLSVNEVAPLFGAYDALAQDLARANSAHDVLMAEREAAAERERQLRDRIDRIHQEVVSQINSDGPADLGEIEGLSIGFGAALAASPAPVDKFGVSPSDESAVDDLVRRRVGTLERHTIGQPQVEQHQPIDLLQRLKELLPNGVSKGEQP